MYYEVYRISTLSNSKVQLCKLTRRDDSCICVSEGSVEQCNYAETDVMILIGRNENNIDILYVPSLEKCRPIVRQVLKVLSNLTLIRLSSINQLLEIIDVIYERALKILKAYEKYRRRVEIALALGYEPYEVRRLLCEKFIMDSCYEVCNDSTEVLICVKYLKKIIGLA